MHVSELMSRNVVTIKADVVEAARIMLEAVDAACAKDIAEIVVSYP